MEYFNVEECCEILDSQRKPITAKNRIVGAYPYYGANGIQDYVKDYLFNDELVLVAEDGGNFGSKTKPIAYRVSGKCWVNNHAHVLKAREDMVNIDYLCYSLMFYNTEGLVNGATRQKLTQASLRKMKIPKRTVIEQKTIVKKLAKLKAIMDKRTSQLTELDNLIKSRFVEMFGDPATNEKQWEILNLEKYTSIITYGLTIRPNYIDNGIELVSAKELHKGYIAYDEAPKISLADYEKLSEKGKPQLDDILFSKTGSIGHCALVEESRKFAITQNAARIGLKHGEICPLWLLYYLRMDFIQKWCKSHSKGNAVKDFQLQDMKAIPVFVCPLDLQNQFATFVEQVNKSKFVFELFINSLLEITDGLKIS